MTFRDKTAKRITLQQSKNRNMRGLWKMVIVCLTDKFHQCLQGKGISNPWLPYDEAVANMKDHASRFGWVEETPRWTKCTM